MKTQEVAKIVLVSPEGVILPYGPSGRLNLPGGGMEPGERPLEALSRELEEEIGLPISEIAPLWVGSRTFATTTQHGEPQMRNWNIYAATTELCASELMFGAEIQGIASLPRERAILSKDVNRSARISTALAFRSIQSLRR